MTEGVVRIRSCHAQHLFDERSHVLLSLYVTRQAYTKIYTDYRRAFNRVVYCAHSFVLSTKQL